MPDASTARLPSLRCPGCAATLALALDDGAPVHRCPSCRGVWVGFVDEKAFLKMKPEVFTVDELHRLRRKYAPLGKDDPVRLRACAVCLQLMYRRNWGGHSGVIVDRCADHGTWFDEGEPEKIREYVEAGGVEFEKLRLTEQGLKALDVKIDSRTAEVDLRTTKGYLFARAWSIFGF